jgi:hypothetical protein
VRVSGQTCKRPIGSSLLNVAVEAHTGRSPYGSSVSYHREARVRPTSLLSGSPTAKRASVYKLLREPVKSVVSSVVSSEATLSPNDGLHLFGVGGGTLIIPPDDVREGC